MIAAACDECSHKFEVPEIRAGTDMLCPNCKVPMFVPWPVEKAEKEKQTEELVGAPESGDAVSLQQQSDAPAAPFGAPRPPWNPDLGPGVGAEPGAEPGAGPGGGPSPSAGFGPRPANKFQPEWEQMAAEDWDDGTSQFSPSVEEAERSSHLLRIGQALAIAFAMPIVGAPGAGLFFPQFSEFPGFNLAGLLLLLPLIAGLTLMAIARQVELPLRGIITIIAGAAMFIVLMMDSNARAMISSSLNQMPGSSVLSSMLAILALGGLVVSARVRWYRPTNQAAYWIGAVAAGFYLLYLFVPANGAAPFRSTFRMFHLSVMLGLGLLSHVALVAAAGVLCAINVPSSFASDASTKAGRAFWCLVGAVVIPALALTIAATIMSREMRGGGAGSPAVLFLSAAVKFGVMFGGLALLIPIGIADILIGRVESTSEESSDPPDKFDQVGPGGSYPPPRAYP